MTEEKTSEASATTTGASGPNRYRRGIIDRTTLFFTKVQKTDGCWLWTGSQMRDGRGQFWDGQRLILAPRYSYLYFFGHLRAEDCVLHTCDIPACVRPDHLFVGDRADNVADMDVKGRRRYLYGEQHQYSKLSQSDIEEIRRRYIPGLNRWQRGNASELALEFGVCKQYISAIAAGQWRAHG